MQAGDLRSKVGFYKRPSSSASPDYGSVEGEFPETPEFTCAANIKPRLGGETVLAQRLTGTNLVNITVRKSSRTALVTDAWQLKDARSGVTYNIRSVIDPYENTPDHSRFFELLCEKGVAVGETADEEPSDYSPALDFSDARNSQYLPILEDV